MGRGKDWRAMEVALLARAWVASSTNEQVGIGQRTAAFWRKVKEKFDLFCPEVYEQGLYKDRPENTLKNYWKDHLHPQVNKFHLAYTKVLAMELTGNLSEDQKINIAVAYYTGAIDKPSYDYRDFDSRKHWKCFGAWYDVMRHQPKWSHQSAAHPGVASGEATLATGEDSFVVEIPPGFIGPPATANTAGVVAGPEGDAAAAAAAETDSSVEELSVAPAAPESVSSRKRGFNGRGKSKAIEKKDKKDEQKAKASEHANTYMKEMVRIANQQATTTGELKDIMGEELKLEVRKQKIVEARTALKFAQAIKDDEMFERAKEELKSLLSTPIAPAAEEPTGALNFDTPSSRSSVSGTEHGLDGVGASAVI